MSVQHLAHMGIEQVFRERGRGWPGDAHTDNGVVVLEQGLLDAVGVSLGCTTQCAAGQVLVHLFAKAPIEQGFSSRFQGVETVEKLTVEAVGQVQQSHPAVQFLNKGYAQQR